MKTTDADGADNRERGVSAFLIAYEVKWRSRVDTGNPYDADPYSRVGRNEMADWCKASGIAIDPLLDANDLQPGLDKLFRRLMREFPGEFPSKSSSQP